MRTKRRLRGDAKGEQQNITTLKLPGVCVDSVVVMNDTRSVGCKHDGGRVVAGWSMRVREL